MAPFRRVEDWSGSDATQRTLLGGCPSICYPSMSLYATLCHWLSHYVTGHYSIPLTTPLSHRLPLHVTGCHSMPLTNTVCPSESISATPLCHLLIHGCAGGCVCKLFHSEIEMNISSDQSASEHNAEAIGASGESESMLIKQQVFCELPQMDGFLQGQAPIQSKALWR